MKQPFALGFDFGTASVRACIIDADTGEAVASAVCPYGSGENGTLYDARQPLLARQSPLDYLASMEKAGAEAVAIFRQAGYQPKQIIGIGVAATASTPIPVTENLQPLAALPRFADNLNAYAWLWKDHTAIEEALQITQIAAQHRPAYLMKCGGSYSSEWFWSKIWHCLRTSPEVFHAAYTWVEQSDFIPAVLAGITHHKQLKRNVCAAGHKAMYAPEWNGLPDKAFLTMLSPELAALRERLYEKAYDYRQTAGILCTPWATKLGLPAGIPIAVGAIDAHVGAIGAGVGKGKLVKIIGTSTCDIMAFPQAEAPNDFAGVAGLVRDSVIPGYIGLEAGQAAVGDLLDWWVRQTLNKDVTYHTVLTQKAAALKPGQSGLLALDWNNGNRNILADQQLTGLLVGQTLATTDYEIYRALIEATAFGARKITELITRQGIQINQIVATGGIGHKNELFMQIYADILGYPVYLVDNPHTVAIGAAIMGVIAAQEVLHPAATIEKLAVRAGKVYKPQPEAQAIYEQLYQLYSQLHESFGRKGHVASLYEIMKALLRIKESTT
ncbi:MAG: ribulokinase [Cytophagales bacterium]|nr:ribulokinase [Bernardetiaceae bacterium]MDW8204731.1 ribulokinase [Cytophagales bacterium]